MILVVALIVAGAGCAGALAVALVGFLLSRWLGRGAAAGTALLLAAAILADLILIVNVLRSARNPDEVVVMRIMAVGYAAPLLIALPCALRFAWVGFHR